MTANNLPVLANPTIASLPTDVVKGWYRLFDAMVWGARSFDEAYPASRAGSDLADELAWRGGAESPWGHDVDIRLFDHWES